MAIQTGAGPYDEAIKQTPELDSILGDGGGLGALLEKVTLAYYVVVGLAGVISQSLMFLYHQRRRPLVEAFVADTPAWIQEPAPVVRRAG